MPTRRVIFFWPCSYGQLGIFNSDKDYESLQDVIAILGLNELSEKDKLTVARARKTQRFLSQPCSVAEIFTGTAGIFRGFADRCCPVLANIPLASREGLTVEQKSDSLSSDPSQRDFSCRVICIVPVNKLSSGTAENFLD